MGSDSAKRDSALQRPTRRQVLGAALGATLAPRLPAAARAATPPGDDAAPPRPTTTAPADEPLATQPAEPVSNPSPWWMQRSGPRSRVVEVNSRLVLRSSVVDVVTLVEMMDQGLLALTSAGDLREAWRSVLNGAQQVAVKFNSVGAELIATNAAIARVLVDSLRRAGLPMRAITLVEAPEHLADELGTGQPRAGWAEMIRVGSTVESLARYFVDADAVINVGTLKTHQIAGMSGCLKNISHAVIRRPGRYHANGCAPFVGHVVGAPPVSSRLRLNVLSALRVVIDGGPDAAEEQLASGSAVLMSFDPVAVDSVGLGLLSVERRRRGLTKELHVPYLAAAGSDGVGRWHAADVEHIALQLES